MIANPHEAAALRQARDDDDAARIARYEIDAAAAELAVLERGLPLGGIADRRHRPHVEHLLAGRAGRIGLDMLQFLLQAAAKVTRSLRRRPTGQSRSAGHVRQGAAGPLLAEGGFDPSILTSRPRILIDVTPTARNPMACGGIPRLVREMARAAVQTGVALPVCMKDGQLVSYFQHPLLAQDISIVEGDIYVIPDVHWYFRDEYRASVQMVKRGGGDVALVVYDLFPIFFPSFFADEVAGPFRESLLTILKECRYCMSISRHTDESVRNYLERMDFPRKTELIFDWFPLGAAEQGTVHQAVRPEVAAVFATGKTFLSVGTLEPRKGYAVALDACDLAWGRGQAFSYVIVGSNGWRSRALQDRIHSHPEYGKRLFWIQDANDAELAMAYASCHCLIQSSIAEGFGLPVIEATRAGAPIIASDLDVFREVAGDQLSYFPVASAPALAECLQAALADRPEPANIVVPDWSHAIRSFAARLLGAGGIGCPAGRES